VCLRLAFLFGTALALISAGPASAQHPEWKVCHDLSFLDEMEAAGARYTQQGQIGTGMRILRDQGMDIVRLRLWHTPDGGRDGLESTLRMADRLSRDGLDLMLDFHYSDFWADPGKQNKPAAWQGLTFLALRDSIRTYSQQVIQALVDQGTPPAIVQIGNETSNGFLWDEGRVGGSFNITSQWGRYAALTKAAIEGVRSAGGDEIKIMIHIDRGGDANGLRWFFDNFTAFNVPFDLIGLSYYPHWHGGLDNLEAAITLATERYGKPVMLAEFAYPWTLQWYDNEANFVGSADQLIDGFPATPAGQLAMTQAVVARMNALAPGMSAGICWWAPDWMAAPGYTSVWENMALFDNSGEVLPAAAALGAPTGTSIENDVLDAHPFRVEIYPNPSPAHQTPTITTSAPGPVRIQVIDLLGRVVWTFDGRLPSNTIEMNDPIGSGVYLARISTAEAGHSVTRLFVVH